MAMSHSKDDNASRLSVSALGEQVKSHGYDTEKTERDGSRSETSTQISVPPGEDNPKAGGEDSHEHDRQEPEYPQGVRLVFLIVSIAMSMFLVALDQSIVGTAIPKITDEFKGLSKVSWYGSAYFMTLGGFQSSWGKIYKYFPLKPAFLVAMFLFELGSLICAVAPSAEALIIGRAIAGIGGAGVTSGVFIMIAFSSTPEKRPMLTGITGSSYGIASVCGPLIGGAFTEKVSWRWCFYINLPIGAVAALFLFLLFQPPASARPANASLREKLLQIDPLGVTMVMSFIICFILAFEYGGQTMAWNSSTVIGLIVGFVAIAITFVVWELKQGERAMVPWHILRRRAVWVNSGYMFFFASAYFNTIYYLPIYFQSIQGTSAIESGVRNLPLIISSTIFTASTGTVVAKTGHAIPIMAIGSVLATIGSGLFYTFGTSTPTGKWIGYQIVSGIGYGGAFQIPIVAVQAATTPADMSTVTSTVMFFQIIAGALGLAAVQSAFVNTMIMTARSTVPDVDAQTLILTGAKELRSAFRPDQVPGIISAYVSGLQVVWAVTIALAGASLLITFAASWKRLTPGASTGAGAMA